MKIELKFEQFKKKIKLSEDFERKYRGIGGSTTVESPVRSHVTKEKAGKKLPRFNSQLETRDEVADPIANIHVEMPRYFALLPFLYSL